MYPTLRIGLLMLAPLGALAADLPILDQPGATDFTLEREGISARICAEQSTDPAVRRAAGDLAADLARVSGAAQPAQVMDLAQARGAVVLIGVLGQSPAIDGLVQRGKLNVQKLNGQWEAAVVQTVDDPWPGVHRALIVAGSDRRGAIYGSYWISESIGVSPWYWWADVPPRRRRVVGVAAGTYFLNSPAVKYRGIFLNDEDWGLRPWAARADPKTGNIGPATYERVFELILRLHGNMLWPAMHPGTRAFNYYPENPKLADEYGIVMGSSHAEPMLRNNVDEWERDGTGEFNYVTNAAAVRKYWAERVQSNAHFENVYTLGMRGIHDGAMQGGGTLAERADRLRKIIADQRQLLSRYVNADPAQVPQLFCPYKEVLPIYEQTRGLVPDDVTLLWPDDNYGYIEHFSSAAEQRRSGGAGVYYHVSYWGRPYDYLWLCSTPPALIGEEMTKAWAHGSQRIWIVNVGDLKPAEWDMEFFLQLACDPSGWRDEDGQHAYLVRTAARDFGRKFAEPIAALLDEYYRLNFARKPEHMGLDPKNRWLAKPAFSPAEARRRLDSFAALRQRADALATTIDAAHADAYYELVLYPVRGAELMNRQWLSFQLYQEGVQSGQPGAERYLAEATAAHRAIDDQTRIYNREIAGGKWDGMMSDHPRDQAVFKLPSALATGDRAASTAASAEERQRVTILAGRPTEVTAGKAVDWRRVGGLGYDGQAVTAVDDSGGGASRGSPLPGAGAVWSYAFSVGRPGEWRLTARLLPTWPIVKGSASRIAVGFDDEPLIELKLPIYHGELDPVWQQAVLRNAALLTTHAELTQGPHRLKLQAIDPGVVVDALILDAP